MIKIYEQNNPTNWNINVTTYQNDEWGSILNGKLTLPLFIKTKFKKVDGSFDSIKFFKNSIRTWINALIHVRGDVLKYIPIKNLPEIDKKSAREVIYVAFEEFMIENEFYQRKKPTSINTPNWSVVENISAISNPMDWFGERSRALIPQLFSGYKIIDIELEDGENEQQVIKNYFIKQNENIEPIGKMEMKDWPMFDRE